MINITSVLLGEHIREFLEQLLEYKFVQYY